MIIKIEQLKTNFNMVWMATIDDKSVCTAISPFEKGCLNITMDYQNGEKERLYYNPSDTSFGSGLIDRMSFKLFDSDNQVIGTVRGENKKVKGFLQSYSYRVFTKKDHSYFLYEVGFGNKGLYLCIYEDDELIAIAEKELTVINYKDIYTVYALSLSNLSDIMALIMHYDVTAYGDIMEISLLSVRKKKVNTVQKELISKFDPDFITKVKELGNKE